MTGATTSNTIDSYFYGLLKLNFASSGAGILDLNGHLILGDYASLEIDASSYDSTSGPSKIPLVKYITCTSSFTPANINIVGLDGVLATDCER